MRLPRLYIVLVVAVVAAIAAVACGDAVGNYPPAQGCAQDAGCSMGSAGGPIPDGGTTTTTTGTGGEVASGTLTGSVQRMSDANFASLTGIAITTPANIVITPSTGAPAPYGGSTGTTFTATGIPSGLAWVEVQDESAGAGAILSTIVPMTMPQIAPVTLPAIDQPTFSGIAADVLGTPASSGAAHVVLILTYSGQPYVGLQVMGSPGGTVAYDNGTGIYSTQTTATGSRGTILILNAAFSGATNITLTDTVASPNKMYTVSVYAQLGAVTLAATDLQP